MGAIVLPRQPNDFAQQILGLFAQSDANAAERRRLAQQQQQFGQTFALDQQRTAAEVAAQEAAKRHTDYTVDADRADKIVLPIMANIKAMTDNGVKPENIATYAQSQLSRIGSDPEVHARLISYLTPRPELPSDATNANAAKWLADSTGRVAGGGQNAIDVNTAMKVATGEQLSGPAFGNQDTREFGPKALESAVAIADDRAPGATEQLRSKTQLQAGREQNASAERIAKMRSDSGGAGGAVKTANASDIAKAIMDGKQAPDLKGLYGLTGPIKAELARAGYDQVRAVQDWTATQKYLATLNGPQQVRLRQAVDFVYESMDNIEQLTKEWDASGLNVLNKANLSAAKQGLLGQKAQSIATRLDGAIADGTGEMAAVLMGGNSPTDHAMELAAHNLSADWSRDTLLDNVKQVKLNLKYRRNSITSAAVVANEGNRYAPRIGGNAPEAPRTDEHPDPLGIFE